MQAVEGHIVASSRNTLIIVSVNNAIGLFISHFSFLLVSRSELLQLFKFGEVRFFHYMHLNACIILCCTTLGLYYANTIAKIDQSRLNRFQGFHDTLEGQSNDIPGSDDCHLSLLFSKLEAYSVLQYMYLWIHLAWNTYKSKNPPSDVYYPIHVSGRSFPVTHIG